jgi:hypothetical protein
MKRDFENSLAYRGVSMVQECRLVANWLEKLENDWETLDRGTAIQVHSSGRVIVSFSFIIERVSS